MYAGPAAVVPEVQGLALPRGGAPGAKPRHRTSTFEKLPAQPHNMTDSMPGCVNGRGTGRSLLCRIAVLYRLVLRANTSTVLLGCSNGGRIKYHGVAPHVAATRIHRPDGGLTSICQGQQIGARSGFFTGSYSRMVCRRRTSSKPYVSNSGLKERLCHASPCIPDEGLAHFVADRLFDRAIFIAYHRSYGTISASDISCPYSRYACRCAACT